MASVTDEGLVIRTKAEILADIFARWRSKPALGADFLSNPDTPQTQIAEPIAEMFAELEEALQALTAAFSRAGAYSQWLDDAGERVGVPRRRQTRSTVTATVGLNAGVTLPAGSQASDSTDPEELYETLLDVSNTTSSPGTFDVEMQAVTPGSDTFVIAGQLSVIATPFAGWTSVTNAADAEEGTDLEADEPYRVRIAQALSTAGTGTVDAIRSAILVLDGVVSASVLANTTSVVDSDGVAPHAFEAVVLGGNEDAIAQAIWENKPAGIYADGSVTSGVAFDSLDQPHVVRFSRPTEVPIYIDFVLDVDSDYPGHAAFKEAAVLEFREWHGLGADVLRFKLADLTFNISGVVNITTLELGFSPNPAGTADLTIDARELATFDTSRITVTTP